MSKTISFKQWVLAEQPKNKIEPFKTFQAKNATISLNPEDRDGFQGKVLITAKYFSNDPAQRTWINPGIPEDRHYHKPVEVGQVMDAIAIFEVVESGDPKFEKGDLVMGFFGWTEYALVESSAIITKVKNDPVDQLASYGGTALTAYFGLLRVGAAKGTDKTIVISGAGGSTGSIVCQIAKHILGCPRVVGIAGGPEKCKLVKEQCGIDACLDYKSPKFAEELKEATPGYIDVYFDNVAGRITDLCVDRLALKGRVVVCGAISSYDDEEGATLSNRSYFKIISMKARLEGFIVSEYATEFPQASKELMTWTSEGKIKPLKTVWETSFDQVPMGMVKLLKGENTGKLVTKL